MKNAKSSNISQVFGFTRIFFCRFQEVAVVVVIFSKKSLTISMIFSECVSVPKKINNSFLGFTVFSDEN